MKISVKVDIEDDQYNEYILGVSGSVLFDEFGIAEKVTIDSPTMRKVCKKKAESLIRSVAERVRAEVLNKIKTKKTKKPSKRKKK